ncbi:MarR family transcriptional regulator [Streptomyces sp. NHF165]|uniref:MarR family winged helix-turn-helix transcriptional regulator n=1 Tax=Streptomyces sp. NHF165 TaxID=2175864 RepID=UPI00132EDE84|nr:helix-turn-helix domain-containing protein [Streptomyces sp. NHF165]QHF93822.1 MarR family transcriptional regulator [Streptomyces sp. NHF165]
MPADRRPLPQLLGEARRWFDQALPAALEAAGTTPLTPAQTQLFAALDDTGTTVAELARRTGVTRQSAHQTAHSLITAGLLEQTPDPTSGRRWLLRRTATGDHAHHQAVHALATLESHLAGRLGTETVTALRTALEQDWGEPPRG